MEPENLHKMRHSLSHLLAAAVLEFYPDAKLAIGPAIDTGFYYDFEFSSPVSDKDLGKIEQKMRELLKKGLTFEKKNISEKEAKKLFANNPYKLELIADIEKEGGQPTIYTSGDFTDLCAGPHISNTKEIPAGSFKLERIAGAYWRRKEKNKMLTRIYGLAFESKEKLEEYEKMMVEAEKRDHRKLAKDLNLFMISEQVGKGLPLWLPNGAFIRHQLEQYMYDKETAHDYKYVVTPVLTHKGLYEKSGHLEHYHNDMYSPINIEGEDYYLKPMNCPHHHMIYNHTSLSYRDLPLRLAEAGLVHRFERSGVLTGLIRARCFTQNDSHIYCAKKDLKNELLGVMSLFKEVYEEFKITDYWYRLSLPDFSNAEKYGDIGNKKMWDEAGQVAEEVLKELGVKYVVGSGEASFYGPKIDVQIKNAIGKEDTIATAQIDFYSAGRFDLEFTNEKGEKEKPVIIHRAIMGSFDRFFAFLTEQTAGNFPLWLSPVQIKIIPVRENHNDYAKKVAEELKVVGVRVDFDDSDEGMGKKIRAGKNSKVPYMLVIGDKEIESGELALEIRDGTQQKITLEKLKTKLQSEISERQ